MTRHEPHGLPRETSACSPSVKQAPKLVWQEAPLGKPLCEDMSVQFARASRKRLIRDYIQQDECCIMTEQWSDSSDVHRWYHVISGDMTSSPSRCDISFFFMNRGLHSNRTPLDSRFRVRRCTDKFYFAAANEIWRSVSSQPRELMYLQNSAKYFQWRSWMYAFGSNELTNSSWWHNDFACWIIKIYLNNKMERSSRVWLVFIGSGRLVNRGTTETEGPRCALLLISFALHSSGWKVFVGYRNCHSCYKCVLYFCWCCMT